MALYESWQTVIADICLTNFNICRTFLNLRDDSSLNTRCCIICTVCSCFVDLGATGGIPCWHASRVPISDEEPWGELFFVRHFVSPVDRKSQIFESARSEDNNSACVDQT